MHMIEALVTKWVSKHYPVHLKMFHWAPNPNTFAVSKALRDILI